MTGVRVGRAARVVAVVVGVALLVVFVVLAVWAAGGPVGPDRAWWRVVVGWRSPALTAVVGAVNVVLAPVLGWAAAVVVGVVAVVGWVRRGWRWGVAGLVWLVVFVVVWRAVVGLKPVVGRARPPVSSALVAESGWGFPSGHVAAVASVGVLASVAAVWFGWRPRLVAAVALAATVVCGFDRMYLGVHYFTDVLGSAVAVWGLGLVLVGVCGCRTRR